MIRVRLLISFVLVALLPVLGVGVATYLVSYQNGKQQSIDRLESVAARKELAIQVWLKSLQQELNVVSQTDISPNFVGTTLRLSNEGKTYAWYNNIVRKRLNAFAGQSSQFEEFFLIDRNGLVALSTDPSHEKLDYSGESFIQ